MKAFAKKKDVITRCVNCAYSGKPCETQQRYPPNMLKCCNDERIIDGPAHT